MIKPNVIAFICISIVKGCSKPAYLILHQQSLVIYSVYLTLHTVKVKKKSENPESFFDQVYEVVRLIPKGRITSYGAIAKYLGTAGSSRMVGWAMNGAHRQKKPVPDNQIVWITITITRTCRTLICCNKQESSKKPLRQLRVLQRVQLTTVP